MGVVVARRCAWQHQHSQWPGPSASSGLGGMYSRLQLRQVSQVDASQTAALGLPPTSSVIGLAGQLQDDLQPKVLSRSTTPPLAKAVRDRYRQECCSSPSRTSSAIDGNVPPGAEDSPEGRRNFALLCIKEGSVALSKGLNSFLQGTLARPIDQPPPHFCPSWTSKSNKRFLAVGDTVCIKVQYRTQGQNSSKGVFKCAQHPNLSQSQCPSLAPARY